MISLKCPTLQLKALKRITPIADTNVIRSFVIHSLVTVDEFGQSTSAQLVQHIIGLVLATTKRATLHGLDADVDHRWQSTRGFLRKISAKLMQDVSDRQTEKLANLRT